MKLLGIWVLHIYLSLLPQDYSIPHYELFENSAMTIDALNTSIGAKTWMASQRPLNAGNKLMSLKPAIILFILLLDNNYIFLFYCLHYVLLVAKKQLWAWVAKFSITWSDMLFYLILHRRHIISLFPPVNGIWARTVAWEVVPFGCRAVLHKIKKWAQEFIFFFK